MKTVSVIITTYNGASSVGTALGSVLNQEGRGIEFELEVLVVDDCSTDGTPDILKKFEVSVLTNETNSGGPNRGRNLGLEKAKGDYISIMDQDDVWESDRLITMLPFCGDFPVVSSGYSVFNLETGHFRKKVRSNPKGFIEYNRNETFLSKLTGSKDGQTTYLGSILFDKELKDISFEETYGMVDFDWCLRLFHERRSVELCRSLYTRNIGQGNLSFNEQYRENDFKYSLETVEQYNDEFPREVQLSRLRIHGTKARYHYIEGDWSKARYYFMRSGFSLKTLLYYLTTFAGHSVVNKHVKVFGQ